MLVEVSAKRINIPRTCMCCGGPPDIEIPLVASKSRGTRVVRTSTNTWNFPYCTDCARHAEAWPSPSYGGELLVSLIVGGIVGFVGSHGGEDPAGITYGIAGFLSLFVFLAILENVVFMPRKQAVVRAMMRPSCAAPAWAARYVGWHGTRESFDFVSADYAVAFAMQNADKLVNLSAELRPHLDQAIETLKSQHIQQTAERLAVEGQRNLDELFHGTVAKLESAKGSGTRRAALAKALEKLSGMNGPEELRARLITEAARIEAAAVLDKVDGLKTVSAKRRNIEEAIAGLVPTRSRMSSRPSRSRGSKARCGDRRVGVTERRTCWK